MIIKRTTRAVLAAALLGTALFASGASSASTSSGELRYAPALYPVSLDVQTFPAEEPVQTAAAQVLETLVTYADGEAQPLLAESWENPDPLTWTFTLREGVMFSDGTPLTANDVKASLDRLIALEGPLTPLFTAVTETRADDDATFTVVTSEPLGTMLSSLSLIFIGQASGVESEEYWLSPIGTGPFVVDEYVADDHIDLVRNEDYWGEPALLDRLTIVNMPEVAARITALQTGEVDVLTGIPPDQVGGVEGQDGIEFVVEDSYQYYFMWFNQAHEPFADVRVRQAMWHAIDIAGLVEDLYGDGATVALAPITQSVFGAPALEPVRLRPRARPPAAHRGRLPRRLQHDDPLAARGWTEHPVTRPGDGQRLGRGRHHRRTAGEGAGAVAGGLRRRGVGSQPADQHHRHGRRRLHAQPSVHLRGDAHGLLQRGARLDPRRRPGVARPRGADRPLRAGFADHLGRRRRCLPGRSQDQRRLPGRRRGVRDAHQRARRTSPSCRSTTDPKRPMGVFMTVPSSKHPSVRRRQAVSGV